LLSSEWSVSFGVFFLTGYQRKTYFVALENGILKEKSNMRVPGSISEYTLLLCGVFGQIETERKSMCIIIGSLQISVATFNSRLGAKSGQKRVFRVNLTAWK